MVKSSWAILQLINFKGRIVSGFGPRSALASIYPLLPYPRENVRKFVYRALKRDWLVKRGLKYRLARKSLPVFPPKLKLLVATNGQWQKSWQMIIFGSSEANREVRNRFRDRLIAFDFKMLHRSVWIGPFLFDELVEFTANNKQLSAWISSCSSFNGKSYQQVADSLWQLNAYIVMIESFDRKCLYSGPDLRSLKLEFADLLYRKPLLPKELSGRVDRVFNRMFVHYQRALGLRDAGGEALEPVASEGRELREGHTLKNLRKPERIARHFYSFGTIKGQT